MIPVKFYLRNRLIVTNHFHSASGKTLESSIVKRTFGPKRQDTVGD
jgi:hypothetical protein